MSHRGDSGQKKIKTASGTAGIKADPSWSLHAIAPTSLTTALALSVSLLIGGGGMGVRETKEDTESSPQLPSHDQRSSDVGGS